MNDFSVAPTPLVSDSKRHSFSPGPRPLQLALSTSTPGSPGPASAPFASYPSPNSAFSESPLSARLARKSGAARRQSSISYFSPKDSEARNSSLRSSPISANYGLTRSVSVGAKPPLSPGAGHPAGDRRSTGSAESIQSERTPHTLAEKHADLLHFIAQKESKCLELRSQLATHEAELLQLKRKWERIVNRGFERSHGINDYSPPNTSSNTSINNQNQGGAVLEGIREGVQGVSRFIAAGLGEFAPAAPSSSSPSPASRSAASRRNHSAQPSSSSVSTYATNASGSTRLSQSSASSLGDDVGLREGDSEPERFSDADGDGEQQVLMVRDTGATPTMSPNPVFVRKHNSGPLEPNFDAATKDKAPSMGGDRNSIKNRRKSRDLTSPPPSAFSKSYDLSTSPTADSAAVRQTLKAKRLSGSGLPPPMSMPGLVSLTGAVGNGNGSWVGSVGKKWEELQRGATFTKSQKRASVLLDNMSQSLASALSSPPLASASYNPTLVGSAATSQSTTPLQSSSSVSLLDDDDTTATHGGVGLCDVMQPSPVSVQPPPQMKANSSTVGNEKGGASQNLDDDEEWGW